MTTSDVTRSGSAAVSTISQLVGKILHLALNVVSTLAVLRYLAPTAYGSFVLVVTLVTLAGVVADFGLPKLAVREIVRADQEQARAQDEIIGTVVVLRLGLALVAAGGCQLVLLLMGEPPVVHQAAAIASLLLLVDAVLSIVLVSFQVHIQQQYEAIVRVVAEAVETGLILVLIAWSADFLWLFVPPVVGVVVGLILAVTFARARFRLRLRPVRARVRFLVAEAWPVGSALILAAVYIKLDGLVLAALRPPADLGIYGSAYQPVEYLLLASAVIMSVLFPLLARSWSRGDTERFQLLYRRGSELLLIVSAFVPLLLAFTAPAVVRLALGEAYADAARPMQVLAVALVTMSLSSWQSLALLSGGLQRVVLFYNSVTLAAAMCLCVLLVWKFGLMGAAVSVLITSILLLVVSVLAVRTRLHATLDLRRLLLVGVALAATAVAMVGLSLLNAHWLLLILAATVVYGFVLQRLGFARSIRTAFA